MTKAASKVIKPFLKSGVAPDAPGSKQAASLLALAGLMKPEEADRRYLAVNGGHGFSTFYGYYMLRAMAAAGNYQGAIANSGVRCSIWVQLLFGKIST